MTNEHQPPKRDPGPWAWIARVVLAGYWLLLFVATHIPAPIPLTAAGRPIDKWVHVVAYFVLAALMLVALHLGGRNSCWRTRLAVLVIAVTYGALDELTQPLVGRICDLGDWYANALGVVLAILADWIYTLTRTIQSNSSETETLSL